MKFSIVVPTRYRSRMLQFFLKSLKINSIFEHELIIVCDIFTSWQTYKFLQENSLYYYQTDFNNWYRMLNFGAEKATCEYLALCQDDVLFGYGWDTTIVKHLNSRTLIAPTFLEHVQGLYFGSMPDERGYRDLEKFDFKAFDEYIQAHAQESFSDDVKHPMVIKKSTFLELCGFTYFTGKDRVHLHHEEGLKHRLRNIGGRAFSLRNSFVYHIPNTGYDEGIPRYGYDFLSEGPSHVPLECKKCQTRRAGAELSQTELDQAILKGFWICETCK